MSVKKYFGLTAAGIASLVATSAMAGGPDVMAAPAPDYSGFYIDGDVGWADVNWSHFIGGVFNPTGRAASPGVVSDDGSGFAWGGDIGYQFNQYYSFEVGAYDLPSARGLAGNSTAATFAPPAATAGPAKVSSWVLYVAGKLSIPIFDNFDLFGKAGIAWRFLNYSGAAFNDAIPLPRTLGTPHSFNDTHYATWLAGAGIQYWITPEWSANVQYLHIPAYTHAQNIDQQAPNVNLIVAGVGYKFNV